MDRDTLERHLEVSHGLVHSGPPVSLTEMQNLHDDEHVDAEAQDIILSIPHTHTKAWR